MLIHTIVSEYISSNTYIVEFEGYDTVILIDCGDIEAKTIIEWLSINNKKPSHVLLTHSDSDHIAGVNYLYKKFDFELRGTNYCSNAIKSSKSNFSKYVGLFQGGFTIELNVVEVNDGDVLEVNGHLFHFIHTPGHTKGCMCIKVDNYLFSGDTIIKDVKTRINHRSGGSIVEYQNSIDKLAKLCDENCLIYPGHGEKINSFFENH